MSYLIRIITDNRWIKDESELQKRQSSSDFPADSISDLKTTSNELSFFRVKSKKDDLIKLVALNHCDRWISRVSYKLIKEKKLKGFCLKDEKDDKCKFKSVGEAHVTIKNLTGKKLIKLARLLAYEESHNDSYDKKQLKSIFDYAVKKGKFKNKKKENHIRNLFDGKMPGCSENKLWPKS